MYALQLLSEADSLTFHSGVFARVAAEVVLLEAPSLG